MAADTYDRLATRMDQGMSSHYIDQCSRNITLSGMTGFQHVYTFTLHLGDTLATDAMATRMDRGTWRNYV